MTEAQQIRHKFDMLQSVKFSRLKFVPLESSVRLAVNPCRTSTRGPSRAADVAHRRPRGGRRGLCRGNDARQARKSGLFAEFLNLGVPERLLLIGLPLTIVLGFPARRDRVPVTR
jgi:hypothetical protein